MLRGGLDDRLEFASSLDVPAHLKEKRRPVVPLGQFRVHDGHGVSAPIDRDNERSGAGIPLAQ
jgi:hypothetical protein